MVLRCQPDPPDRFQRPRPPEMNGSPVPTMIVSSSVGCVLKVETHWLSSSSVISRGKKRKYSHRPPLAAATRTLGDRPASMSRTRPVMVPPPALRMPNGPMHSHALTALSTRSSSAGSAWTSRQIRAVSLGGRTPG